MTRQQIGILCEVCKRQAGASNLISCPECRGTLALDEMSDEETVLADDHVSKAYRLIGRGMTNNFRLELSFFLLRFDIPTLLGTICVVSLKIPTFCSLCDVCDVKCLWPCLWHLKREWAPRVNQPSPCLLFRYRPSINNYCALCRQGQPRTGPYIEVRSF